MMTTHQPAVYPLLDTHLQDIAQILTHLNASSNPAWIGEGRNAVMRGPIPVTTDAAPNEYLGWVYWQDERWVFTQILPEGYLLP